MEVQEFGKKTLTHLPERPAVDITFQDLSYSVPAGRTGSKAILKEITGSFKAGQLAAILGPSGAGKSTLLNVLAGYKGTGMSGVINVNGNSRDLKQFRRISRYIMQEDVVQPHLTVQECMHIAAEFKLGSELSNDNKFIAITEVLSLLNLLKHKDTKTHRLSGGERKRLSIALELVDNPPVIFLDEPTTGLDYIAGLQCVSLLKTLAQGGRTVVCSVHTPTAKVFGLFDHVYILSQGQCVFQGLGSDIVPFLRDIGLPCPTHYNPADFMIDVASGEYGCHVDELVALTKNGRAATTQDHDSAATETGPFGVARVDGHGRENRCSTWKQFTILLHRMYLQRSRNFVTTAMLVLMYVFMGAGQAMLFQNVCNDAAVAPALFGFIFTTVLIHLFCPAMESLLSFALEIDLIKREHFNRWYNVQAYFWARTLFTVPYQLVYSTVFTAVIFWPTGLPAEADRLAKFVLLCVLVALISETIGLCVATVMKIVNALFFAQVVMSPLVVMAAYSLGFKELPLLIVLVVRMDYLRHALEGFVNVVFENREKIACPDTSEFCLYTYTRDVRKLFLVENTDYWLNVAVLLAFLVFIKAFSLFLLVQKLAPNKIVVRLKSRVKALQQYFGI